MISIACKHIDVSKKKYTFNITLSVIFLILHFSIFFANIRAQIKREDLSFKSSVPLKLCTPLLFNRAFNNLTASDKNYDIFVSYPGGYIESIDLQTTEIIWKTQLNGEIISGLVLDKIDSESIYVVTNLKSPKIWAINAKTGITKWQIALPSTVTERVFLYDYRDTLIIVCKNGEILSFRKNAGTINWFKSLNISITSKPFFYRDRVFLSTADNKIFSIILHDGAVTSQIKTPVSASILVALTEKEFVWADKTGRLFHQVNQKFRAGAEISDISVTSHGILIASNDNFLYLISKAEQKILWKKKMAGRVSPKPLVIDNWAFVSVLGESKVSVIDLTNGKVINVLEMEDGNYFVEDFFIVFNKLFIPTIKGLYSFSSDTSNNFECT